MPIIRMASKYDEIPSGAANVRLYQDLYRHTTIGRYSDGTIWQNLNPQIPIEEQPPEGYVYTPLLWLYDTHVGLCIEDYERNGYSDSDWYMVVWNPETKKPETIEFASTRGWSYPCYGSRPDATPEVLSQYQNYKRVQAEAAERERQVRLAKTPAKGKALRVVRGRKIPVGTTGVCVWIGDSTYGTRCGIKDEAGQVHWTAVSNVEVVEPQQA